MNVTGSPPQHHNDVICAKNGLETPPYLQFKLVKINTAALLIFWHAVNILTGITLWRRFLRLVPRPRPPFRRLESWAGSGNRSTRKRFNVGTYKRLPS